MTLHHDRPARIGPPIRLVRFSSLGVDLDGALYEPASRPGGAVVYLHGKGGNFYTGPSRFIPEHLASSTDWVHLAINMRCRDLAYTVFDHEAPDIDEGGAPVTGGMWEEIATGHEDVAAASAFLQQSYGPIPLVVAGHSSGGWYAADYAARRPEGPGAPSATILLSPLMTNRTALSVWFPHPERLATAEKLAHELVLTDRAETLIPLPCWYRAISARSLVERLAEEPDAWTTAFGRSPVPSLLICGGNESRRSAWEALVAGRSLSQDRCEVIDGAGHHFAGSEGAVADFVRDFLDTIAAQTGDDNA